MRKWLLFSLNCVLVMALFSLNAAGMGKDDKADVKKISPKQARADVLDGKALLVCSYDDYKCSSVMLEGAILKSELEAKLPSLSMEQEIIFYCG